jgi:mannan endo-1,6-alpha-mannosidase
MAGGYYIFVSVLSKLTSRGLKWQIFTSNVGYDYKSSIANTAFMQLAARLARYTDNITYAEWADKTFDWLDGVGFINTTTWLVNDGAGDTDNCTAVDQAHWTYNAATSIYASAVMYNITSASIWSTRLNGLVATATKTFFTPSSNATNVMYEAQCELSNTCNNDQYSFKAYLSRWMAKSTLLVSNLTDTIEPLLTKSANAAAQACSGNDNNTCGTKWYVGGYDGVYGLGQYLSALETIQSLLVFHGDVQAPGTEPNVHWSGRFIGQTKEVKKAKGKGNRSGHRQ